MANCTSPIEAPSGRVRWHRLNRGGNRQTDKAIHIAVITQIARPGTEGRRYYEGCLTRGETRRRAIRALKLGNPRLYQTRGDSDRVIDMWTQLALAGWLRRSASVFLIPQRSCRLAEPCQCTFTCC